MSVLPSPTTPVELPPPSRLATPDLTAAQIVAAAGGAIGLAVALGVPLSHAKQQQLTLFIVVFAPVLVTVDAAIRHSRAKYLHNATQTALEVLAGLTPTANATIAQVVGEVVATNGGEPERPTAEPAAVTPAVATDVVTPAADDGVAPPSRPAVPARLEIT